MHRRNAVQWAIIPLLAFLGGWMVMGGGKGIGNRVRVVLVEREARAALTEKWSSAVSRAASLSDGGGSMVLIEFADYECPFCRKASPVIDSVLALTDYRIGYLHFPLTSTHQRAAGAAAAAVCAGVQARFIQMHHALMTEKAWLKDSDWVTLAATAGVADIPSFTECLGSQKTLDRLEEDRRLGVEFGAYGTPTYFSAYGPYRGEITVAALDSLARLSLPDTDSNRGREMLE